MAYSLVALHGCMVHGEFNGGRLVSLLVASVRIRSEKAVLSSPEKYSEQCS